MNRMLKTLAAVACAAAAALSMASCARSTELGNPGPQKSLANHAVRSEEEYVALKSGAENFAARFAPAAYDGSVGGSNYVVSPVSVYMGLSLAAECAAGRTREQLVSALGVSYETLRNNISDFYSGLYEEHGDGYSPKSLLKLSNSVWVGKGTQTRDDCIRTLAEKYQCYSYMADFLNDNGAANAAVRKFVREQTNGLIDSDFRLSEETLFTLVNTLYLKDVWNVYGADIAVTSDNYAFTQGDGTTKDLKLMQGGYKLGRAYDGDRFTSFYTTTYRGYRIKFILPKEGHTAAEVFTAENIAAANGVTDYGGVDDRAKKEYYTRCLFPQFEGAYNNDVLGILRETFAINDLFDPNACDLSSLAEEKAYCAQVSHVAKLKVDRKGIEGAAVTVIPGAGASGPGEYERVYLDFVVNRAFGFVLTDRYDVTLFSGVVNTV